MVYLVTDGLLGTLGHADHQEVVQPGAEDAQGEDAADLHQELGDGGEIGGAGLHHRQDVIIHQGSQRGGAGGGGCLCGG